MTTTRIRFKEPLESDRVGTELALTRSSSASWQVSSVTADNRDGIWIDAQCFPDIVQRIILFIPVEERSACHHLTRTLSIANAHLTRHVEIISAGTTFDHLVKVTRADGKSWPETVIAGPCPHCDPAHPLIPMLKQVRVADWLDGTTERLPLLMSVMPRVETVRFKRHGYRLLNDGEVYDLRVAPLRRCTAVLLVGLGLGSVIGVELPFNHIVISVWWSQSDRWLRSRQLPGLVIPTSVTQVTYILDDNGPSLPSEEQDSPPRGVGILNRVLEDMARNLACVRYTFVGFDVIEAACLGLAAQSDLPFKQQLGELITTCLKSQLPGIWYPLIQESFSVLTRDEYCAQIGEHEYNVRCMCEGSLAVADGREVCYQVGEAAIG